MVLFKSQGLQQCQHLLCVCVCWGGGGREDHKSLNEEQYFVNRSRTFFAHTQTLVKLGSALLLGLIIKQYVTSVRGYHRWLACKFVGAIDYEIEYYSVSCYIIPSYSAELPLRVGLICAS